MHPSSWLGCTSRIYPVSRYFSQPALYLGAGAGGKQVARQIILEDPRAHEALLEGHADLGLREQAAEHSPRACHGVHRGVSGLSKQVSGDAVLCRATPREHELLRATKVPLASATLAYFESTRLLHTTTRHTAVKTRHTSARGIV